MFKIAFYLFDYKDGSFKKVYFHCWNDSKPVFTKNKKRANVTDSVVENHLKEFRSSIDNTFRLGS